MTQRREIGDHAACTRCGQDIEWHGRALGWADRGSGHTCLPYIERGEVFKPRGKHTVRTITKKGSTS